MRPAVSAKLVPFGTTIFTTMSRLAAEHGAVNLSQGFPDFEGPAFVKEAAARALHHEHNQYAPMPGLPALRARIAERFTRDTALACDPDAQVVVTAGCTEAIAAALLGVCDPGDEVVLFEPYYDSYRACVAMAGCTARFVALRPGADGVFRFDPAELAGAFTGRTRAVIVNTPHNPTGKVFSREELEQIAACCRRTGAIAIADEVYERLLFEPSALPHICFASLPGMAGQTLTLSSIGKTFSLTGWKIGWAVGPASLAAAVRSAHQFLTFAVATPLQHGAAEALKREAEYVPELVALLDANRRRLGGALSELGFVVHPPAGTYFICADHSAVSRRLGAVDDAELSTRLIRDYGVAAIPPSVFYDRKHLGRNLLRFAFCKKPETIEEGIRRLRALARA